MADLPNTSRLPMSPEEVELVRVQMRRTKTLVVVMLVLTMPWLALIVFGIFRAYINLIIAAMIPFVFCGAMYVIFLVFYRKYGRDIDEGMKLSYVGPFDKKVILRSRYNVSYYLKIAGKDYSVPKDLFDLLADKDTVRLDLAPYSRQVLIASKA